MHSVNAITMNECRPEDSDGEGGVGWGDSRKGFLVGGLHGEYEHCMAIAWYLSVLRSTPSLTITPRLFFTQSTSTPLHGLARL